MHSPPSRRPPVPQMSAAGLLSFDGLAPADGGAGLVARDERTEGFYARIVGAITGSGSPADYRFVRVESIDVGMPTDDTLVLPDDDGLLPFCRESRGRTDVPTDGSAVVWLRPMHAVPGLTFEYNAPASGGGSIPDYHGAGSADTPSLDDTWQDASIGADVTIASAGYHLVTGKFGLSGKVSGAVPSTAPVLAARLYDVGGATYLQESVVTLTVAVSGVLFTETRSFAVFVYFYAPTTLRVQKYRSAPGTAAWVTDAVGAVSFGSASTVAAAQWGAVKLS